MNQLIDERLLVLCAERGLASGHICVLSWQYRRIKFREVMSLADANYRIAPGQNFNAQKEVGTQTPFG
jgi:hypothetical protein